MEEKQSGTPWKGLKGRIAGWYFGSPFRHLEEILLWGDVRASVLEEIARRLKGDEVVLDIGAGAGYLSLPVARMLKSGKVMSLDLSDEMLHGLKKNIRRKGLEDKVQILKSSATSIDLGDESIDIVVSICAFHEFPNPKGTLLEAIRILRPNGPVIVADFRDTFPGKLIANDGSIGHGPWKADDMKALFVSVGLREVVVKTVRNEILALGVK